MNYTSIEQSKHLLELGLDAGSADMYYSHRTINITFGPKYSVISDKEYHPHLKREIEFLEHTVNENIPCWSIGALLKLIPNYGLRYMGGKHWIYFYSAPRITSTPTHIIDDCKDELEACYGMIVWLLEQGYIK